MTSINAIKFNFHSGALVSDEQRSWNTEDMKILSVEKIKPIIPPEIQARYGIVGCYGNTGTSTIGDELRWSIQNRIKEVYAKDVESLGRRPKDFKTIEEIAMLGFDVITNLKLKHIDDELNGKYGFKMSDFIRGHYLKNGEKVEIKDKDVIAAINERITWKSRGEDSRSVFLNAGIIAGYEPKEGFRIFHTSMIEHFVESVQAIFVADGSGVDTANIVFSDYAAKKTVPERRGDIDPVEGMYTIIDAVNTATRYNLGVGGYLNIILCDGSKADNSKKMWRVNDHRAKLASEAVNCHRFGLMDLDSVHRVVDDLIFKEKDFNEVHDLFWKKAKNVKKVHRFLRGYKLD